MSVDDRRAAVAEWLVRRLCRGPMPSRYLSIAARNDGVNDQALLTAMADMQVIREGGMVRLPEDVLELLR